MKNDNTRHLKNLRDIHQRRLQILEVKAAKFGDLDVPPYIEMEIIELKSKIAEIDAQLTNSPVDKKGQTVYDHDDLATLRIQLITHFTIDEMRTLCFDLGVDSENFPPLKDSFTRELINHFVRRGAILELLNWCRKTRPNVSWG